MSKILQSILLSTLLILSLGVLAAPGNKAQNREEFHALRMEKAKLHAQERLLFLKQSLNLKESQLSAWQAYASHVEENSAKPRSMAGELRKKHEQTGQPPTAIELAEANLLRLENKLVTARQQLAVFSELYQVLDQQQRATVDRLTLRKIKKEARKARGRKQQGNN